MLNRRRVLATTLAASAVVIGRPRAEVLVSEVTLGVLTDFAGLNSDTAGPGSVYAAELAIEDFRAERSPTFGIKVISGDHLNKSDVGSSIARQWFDTDKVDAIFDVPTSPVALAVAQVAKEKSKVVIVSGAATTALTEEMCTPTVLLWSYDFYSSTTGVARDLTLHGSNTWFFLTADYAGGHALEDYARTAIAASDGKVLGRVLHPYGTTDLSSYLLQAQASGAKVIGLANAAADTRNSIKQAAEFGITPSQRLVPFLLYITDVHALGLNVAAGITHISSFYWDLDDRTRALANRFYATQKRMPSLIHAGVYSSVLNYLRAVHATGSKASADVIAYLKKSPVEDAFARNGKVRPDGLMVHDMLLLTVKSPQESKYPWDYSKIDSVIPGDQAFKPLSQSRCPMLSEAGGGR